MRFRQPPGPDEPQRPDVMPAAPSYLQPPETPEETLRRLGAVSSGLPRPGAPSQVSRPRRALALAILVGAVVAVGLALNAVDRAGRTQSSYALPDGPVSLPSVIGNTPQPAGVRLEPGRGFRIRGLDYAAGWRFGTSQGSGSPTIVGLRATNHDREPHNPDLDIVLVHRGFREPVLCFTLREVDQQPGVEDVVPPGETRRMLCGALDDRRLPPPYDRILAYPPPF